MKWEDFRYQLIAQAVVLALYASYLRYAEKRSNRDQ